MAVEDQNFAIQREFASYIHPLKSITDDAEEKACWIDQMKYLVKDFKVLLKLPFKKFWSTIVFNKEATMGLNSFLQEAAPPHLMDQLPQDDDILEIYSTVDYYAFLVFKRLTKHAENLNNQMSSYYMWNLVCDKNIIDISMLFDICSIYGQTKKKELEKIFLELFSSHPLYTEHLKTSIQITINCLCQFQEKVQHDLGFKHEDDTPRKIVTSAEINKDILPVIEDIILFLLDTACSISNFLEIYPKAAIIFYQEQLHMQIAAFYHNINPLIYEKLNGLNKVDQFQEKLQASRILLMKIVQQCLSYLNNDVMTKKKAVNPIEEYLGVLTELLNFSEFIADYNVLHNLTKDIKRCQKIHKQVDSARYDYLLKSIELMSIANREFEQVELESEQLELQTSSKNLENATLQSRITEIKELLPQLGDGFIQKCLEYYNMDSEKVINMILEKSFPPELTQYDFDLSSQSLHNVNVCYEENASGYDPSYKGSKKLKKLKAVLDDKSFRNEMRSFYEKYNYTEVSCVELETYYEDEYDDTYDNVIEYKLPEQLDENQKRRPDVVPRVLMEKKTVEEEVSDDEPQSQPVINFTPFCENPEVIRERQARKYAAKQFNRGNRNSKYIHSN
ncbi:Hypothetical protein CINCED_3A008291 [Cinara cedri]|uniref:CUE domain-containing protein n=1 Tax=Cinara cedri TaxID=506608 RepID=A0A5E4N4K6_9HEMI|nr:Hypothetical protein CINCED_3A008291 [Cinara cedri]